MNTNKAAKARQGNILIIEDIERHLAERQRRYDEIEAAHVAEEGKRRFDEWLASMRRRFADEARVDYRAAHPRPTFRGECAIRVTSPSEANRKSRIDELVALYDEERGQ